MKKVVLALCLALGACNGVGALTGLPPSPVAAADRTVLDEQAITAVELAYKAARIAVETSVDAGFIKGAAATKVAALDDKAYAAVRVARGFYAAGNATGYFSAIGQAKAAVADLLALTGK